MPRQTNHQQREQEREAEQNKVYKPCIHSLTHILPVMFHFLRDLKSHSRDQRGIKHEMK